MRSRYFIESEARLKTLKFTKVPPAVVDRIRFFQLRHSCVLKKDKKGELYVNRAALRAFYAQNKKRKLPITYELRWELACEQGWKCKMCKKKLKVGSFFSLFSSFSSQKEKIKFITKKVTAQVDHVKPLGQGGADAVHNIQVRPVPRLYV